MYIDYAEKKKEEERRTQEEIALWLKLDKPEKCVLCLHYLNHCKWWEKNYECEKAKSQKLKQDIQAFQKRSKPRRTNRTLSRTWRAIQT